MKKIFFIILFFLMSPLIAGEVAPIQKRVAVEIKLIYTNPFGSETRLQNTLKMQQNNPWVIIGSMQSQTAAPTPSQPPLPSYNQFLLLGKVQKADTRQITLQFLVIDQDSKSNFVIEPQVTVKYQQKGEIQLHKDNRNIHIKVLAKKESAF